MKKYSIDEWFNEISLTQWNREVIDSLVEFVVPKFPKRLYYREREEGKQMWGNTGLSVEFSRMKNNNPREVGNISLQSGKVFDYYMSQTDLKFVERFAAIVNQVNELMENCRI